MGSIVSYCQIRENRILRNGQEVFKLSKASLDHFMIGAYENSKVNYPKFYKMDRLSKLGFLSSEVILSELSQKPGTETAVILSNSNSSLDTDLRFWESAQTQASPSLFVYTLPNIVTGEICIRNGYKGESNFFITPEFDSTWMADYVNMILLNESVDTCLAGWVDVLADHADVFLYLVTKSNDLRLTHKADTLKELYESWNN